jgi:hypothetical protein
VVAVEEEEEEEAEEEDRLRVSPSDPRLIYIYNII